MPPTAIYQRPVGTVGRARRSEWPAICVAAFIGATLGAAGATTFFTHHAASSDLTPFVEPACELPLPASTPAKQADVLL